MNDIKSFYKAFLSPVGSTDDITTCDCCGKSDLKGTVVFQFDEDAYEGGTPRVYGYRFLGSHCALNVKKYASNAKRNKIIKSKIEVATLKDAVITANNFTLTFKAGDFCYNQFGTQLTYWNITQIWNEFEWTGDVEGFKKHFTLNYHEQLS